MEGGNCLKPSRQINESAGVDAGEGLEEDILQPDYWHLMALEGGSGSRLAMFTPAVTRVLREWVCRNLQYPFASRQQKIALANATGLTVLQVTYWLTNARRRLVPRLLRHENRRRELLSLPMMKKPQRGMKSRSKLKLRKAEAGFRVSSQPMEEGPVKDRVPHFDWKPLSSLDATAAVATSSDHGPRNDQADLRPRLLRVIQPILSQSPSGGNACPSGVPACYHGYQPCRIIPTSCSVMPPPAFNPPPLVSPIAVRSVIQPTISYNRPNNTCVQCEVQQCAYQACRPTSVIRYGL